MALALGVRFNPAAGGTTDFVYASTVTGYRVATSVLVNSSTYRYRAESADLSQWEYGTAIWSSTTSTLSRNTITDSSNAGAKVNFTSAPQVAITIDVPDVLSFDTVMSLTTAQQAQARSNIAAAPAITTITNSLSADVAMNNTANYFDGPSVAQGATGTWWVSGSVTILDTAGAANYQCKLWDGTTVIASGTSNTNGASVARVVTLSGFITSPAGNLRISCKDITSTSGAIVFNSSGNSKDSTISAIRIA